MKAADPNHSTPLRRTWMESPSAQDSQEGFSSRQMCTLTAARVPNNTACSTWGDSMSVRTKVIQETTACRGATLQRYVRNRNCIKGTAAVITIAPSTALGKSANKPAKGIHRKTTNPATAPLNRLRAPDE